MIHTVGYVSMSVPDSVQGASIPVHLLYPSQEAEAALRLGPYSLSLAMNAPLASQPHGLVIISHGGGGSGLTYRDLAVHLVRAGFVVALPEHPGNSRADNSLEGTRANLLNRPRHIRLVIDAILTHPLFGHRLNEAKISLIGHSMGGYTALALVGGRAAAGVSSTGEVDVVEVEPDARINTLVLLAPACGWFNYAGSLADVRVPILLMTAEKDALAMHLHTDMVKTGVPHPERVDVRVVANAGHHSFQSQFPPEMTRPNFAPSQDPAGFDRGAFLPLMNAQILGFLQGLE